MSTLWNIVISKFVYVIYFNVSFRIEQQINSSADKIKKQQKHCRNEGIKFDNNFTPPISN